MNKIATSIALIAILATCTALPSVAQTNMALPSIAPTSNAETAKAPPLQTGSTVNNGAYDNQKSPGTSQELSPDTKQSATGDSVGSGGRGGASGRN